VTTIKSQSESRQSKNRRKRQPAQAQTSIIIIIIISASEMESALLNTVFQNDAVRGKKDCNRMQSRERGIRL